MAEQERWNGIERRQGNFCASHIEIVKSVAVIETSIANMESKISATLGSIDKHVSQGNQWRLAIVGVAAMVILQFIGFLNYNSKMSKQIEINTKRLDIIEGQMTKIYSTETTLMLNTKSLDRIEASLDKMSDRIHTLESTSYGYQDAMKGRASGMQEKKAK